MGRDDSQTASRGQTPLVNAQESVVPAPVFFIAINMQNVTVIGNIYGILGRDH